MALETGCNNVSFPSYTFNERQKSTFSTFRSWPGKSVNPTFHKINLTKLITNLIAAWKSLKNGCKDLYFHPYTFAMINKSFSFLTLLSCRDSVNPSILTFGSISLTEKATNLLVAWKNNQK